MTPLRSTNADAGSLGQRQRGKWIVTSHHMLASPVQFSSSTIHTQPGTETERERGRIGRGWRGGGELREGGRGWAKSREWRGRGGGGGRGEDSRGRGLKDDRHKLNLACRDQFSQHSAENERRTGRRDRDRQERGGGGGGEREKERGREGERRWTEVNEGAGAERR